MSYFEIFRNNLFGLDIQDYSIKRSKLLLILLAITKGEDLENFDFNLNVEMLFHLTGLNRLNALLVLISFLGILMFVPEILISRLSNILLIGRSVHRAIRIYIFPSFKLALKILEKMDIWDL